MISDPIADMFVRIKNAYAVGKKEVRVPYSRLKHNIAHVLVREGFIADVDKKGKEAQKRLVITLAYHDEVPSLRSFRRLSKLSQREYRGYKDMYSPRSGYGVGIVSTSHGVMTTKEARKKKVGGEVLVEVW